MSISVLDYIADKMHYNCLSDIRYTKNKELTRLIGVVEQMPHEFAELPAWNDALTYLTAEPEQETRFEAKERLVDALRGKIDNDE